MSTADCGCDGMMRCKEHHKQIMVVSTAWSIGGAAVKEAVWAESDGYDEPGFIPVQGYDWSGIRDSTPEAVTRMYNVALERMPELAPKPQPQAFVFPTCIACKGELAMDFSFVAYCPDRSCPNFGNLVEL